LTGKQIASLSGLASMTRRSGKWTGKTFIQGGRKHLREALYMPALVAARFSPDLKCKYQVMVAAGNPPKSPSPLSCESSSNSQTRWFKMTGNGFQKGLDQDGYSKDAINSKRHFFDFWTARLP